MSKSSLVPCMELSLPTEMSHGYRRQAVHGYSKVKFYITKMEAKIAETA